MVSGSLALLYFLLGFHGGRQGSGPDRGQSPVEWGDFLSVRSFVRPSVPPLWAIQPSLRPSQQGLKPEAGWLAGPQIWLAGPQAWLDGPEVGDGQTYRKSPHSTGLGPLLGPLPCLP